MEVTEKLLQLFQFPNVACQHTYPHSADMGGTVTGGAAGDTGRKKIK